MALYSLSICSGVGGLDLAIELAAPGAFTPVSYVEGEGYAASILAARMADKALPLAPVWSNVKTLCDAKFRAYVRERTAGQGIDFIFGGIPCQPHSVAGKQLGADDPRDLWPDTVRILETFKPWLFFLENVPGMLGDVSRRAIVDLQRIGYIVPRPILLEAAHVGAPQRRERLFVLAYRQGGLPRRTSRGRTSRNDTLDHGTLANDDGDGITRERIPEPEGRIDLADAGWCGPAMADAADAGGRREGSRGRSRSRDVAADASGTVDALGDANGSKRRPKRRTDRGRPGGEGIGDRASGADLGNAASDGRPTGQVLNGIHDENAAACGLLERIGSSSETGFPYWPPGPADRREWQRILETRPDLAPAIKSALRGMADGLPGGLGDAQATRVDELRALGNAVVPLCGAVAFLIQLERLKEALNQ